MRRSSWTCGRTCGAASALLLSLLLVACGSPQVPPEDAPIAWGDGAEAGGGAAQSAVPSEPEPPPGLVPVDYYDPDQPPPPPIAALVDVAPCPSAGRLAGWVREALEPFGGPKDAPFELLTLSDVIDVAPVVLGVEPACALAGRQGDAHAWELRDADGSLLARGVASPELASAVPRIYERQETLGGISFGQYPLASRQHVAGVLRDGLLELELAMHRPVRSALYVVEVPSVGPVTDGMEAQQVARELVGRLTTSRLEEPFTHWPSALPRALPPGYGRCAGPYLTEGFQTEATELCNGQDDVIVVHTENKGANPVPDPPVRTEVEEVDGRIRVAIWTPVEDVVIDAPAVLGRDVVEAMAATVPLADRRVWFPARGRGKELTAIFGPEWLVETLTRAGAEVIKVTEGAWACARTDEDDQGCSPPDPLSYEVRMRDPAGHTIEAYTSALPDAEGQQVGPAGPITRAYTVGSTDLLVEDDTRTAWAQCGGVTLRLRPAGFGSAETPDHDRAEPSIALLVRVLEDLGC